MMQGAIERRTVEETAHLGEEVRVAVVITTKKGVPLRYPKYWHFARVKRCCLLSSGGKTRLGHISLRGNVYLRTLLVQNARSTLQLAVRAAPTHVSRLQRGLRQLHERKGYQKTLIAIANKHARMLWAMLPKAERYEPDAWQRHPMHPPLPAAAA